MSPKSLAGTILAALTAATWAPMQAPAQEAPRFFANFPLLIDPAPPNDRSPFHFAAHHISTDSNAVAFHMEWFGVPWREFASGRNPPEAWLREMDAIRGLEERLGLPVYVALTPIGGNRDRLAASPAGTYALTQDDSVGSRCESIETRPDYETVIRPGFQRYVSYMIRRFQPRFLALSIEANIYQYLCPAAWNAMQQLLNETYDMFKLENPDLPVFHTIQADLLWQADNRDAPCFGFRRDCLIGNVERLANLKTDLYALSTYPADTYLNNGRQLPDDYLTVIGPLSGKPLAVSETGYPAITFSGQISGTCVVAQPSSPADQARWMARLLHDAQRAQMPFVVWWANEDVMPASVLAPCICEDDSVWCRFLKILDEPGRNSIRGFGTMGIRAFDATTRPARNLWKAAVTQSRNQGN